MRIKTGSARDTFFIFCKGDPTGRGDPPGRPYGIIAKASSSQLRHRDPGSAFLVPAFLER